MTVQGATKNFRPWTSAEDAAILARLRAVRVPGGVAQLARELDRTTCAVHHRAQRLGILRNRRWTAEDDRRLALLWGECSLNEVAKKLDRTPATTYWRAQHAGLPLGCAQGLEYLWAAAVRTGFAVATLRMILKWGGVSLRVAMARPTGAKRHFHTVDPYDVDQAVKRWLATETLAAAADRHGVDPATLERRLRASGRELPEKPARKKRWRVPSDLVDEVLAERRAA